MLSFFNLTCFFRSDWLKPPSNFGAGSTQKRPAPTQTTQLLGTILCTQKYVPPKLCGKGAVRKYTIQTATLLATNMLFHGRKKSKKNNNNLLILPDYARGL